MSLSSDLMGFGVSPLQAARTATAGIGPIAATAAGTNIGTAKQIGASQYLTIWTVAAGSSAAILPTTGETGALLGDDYIIHCGGTSGSSLLVFPPSGFTLNVIGVVYNVATPFPVIGLHTLTVWYTSTSQMFGIYA